jgi:hypothetical protein
MSILYANRVGRLVGGSVGVPRLFVAAVFLFAATAVEARPYRLLWNANTDGVTTGYRVYYGTLPGTYQPAGGVDNGNDTEFQVDLTPGTTYYFMVRAYNSEGTLGPPSAELGFPVPLDATIIAVPSTVASGQTITVTAANGPGHRFDWVGLYPVGNSYTGYIAEKYLNNLNTPPLIGLPGGIVTFQAPAQPGQYNVRFNSYSSATSIATSTNITVNGNASVSCTPSPIGAGSTLTCTVANAPGMNRFDWVGFYPTGNGFGGYIYEKYLNNTNSAPASPLTGGTITFPLAASLPPGTYNVRLNSASTSTTLATSSTITVTSSPTVVLNTTTIPAGGSVTATVSNSPGGSRYDYVGLYTTAATNTAWYLTYKYLNNTQTAPPSPMTSGSIGFTAPTTPGQYNVRLVSASGTQLAVSQTLNVTSSASVTPQSATVARGANLQVTVANGPGARWDWVGLYPVGNGHGGFVDWKYLSGTQTPPGSGLTGATLTFTMPNTPGQYNFRFFYTYDSNPVATSFTVTVQ